MSAPQQDPTRESPEVEPLLPEPLRQRVIALVAAVLPQIPAEEMPAPLRRVASFAPNRRAKLGGAPIATQLMGDPPFRTRVAALVIASAGPLGTAVHDGDTPNGADPLEVAALAYLDRPAGWRDLVGVAGEQIRSQTEGAQAAAEIKQAEQRAVRAEQERAHVRVEADKLRDELARVRDELNVLKEEHRVAGRALRESQSELRRAQELLATERGRAKATAADHDAELRRIRGKLAEAEAAASGARQTARQNRAMDEARLWLLLETIGQSAAGLRRELALEPVDLLPADVVASEHAQVPAAPGANRQARDTDDPALLDQLLSLPKAHLVVDGYNVTKRGYGDISLEQQRTRLITGVGGMAAQTRIEVTIVFDGADKIAGVAPAPRGVRVLFSKKGETADELIRRLVRAEPGGRTVVVVSSDREVADGVRRHGAYPVGADALLRRLSRA